MTKPDKEPTALLTLKQVSERLSVSAATVKNWVRLGRLESADGMHFEETAVAALNKALQNGSDSRLKSRRNKMTVSGRTLYKNYISHKDNIAAVSRMLELCGTLSEGALRVLLAHGAAVLFRRHGGKTGNAVWHALLRDLTETVKPSDKDAVAPLLPLCDTLQYCPDEDTLGFLYLSLRDLGKRKHTGAYYTPADTVNRLLDSLQTETDFDGMSFLDPCCGSGNFLIGLLARGAEPAQLYGMDSDEISVQLTRINLYLRDGRLTETQLKAQFVCGNALAADFPQRFSAVIGNPPWGYAFSEAETAQYLPYYRTAKKKGTESFDLFLEKGLALTESGGLLAYVLPEALFNAAAHKAARRIITDTVSFRFVVHLGNAFGGVQCPALILGLKKDGNGSTKGCRVQEGGRAFTVGTDRPTDRNTLSFWADDAEYDCLRTIAAVKGARYLAGNADFALGIVTGSNKAHLQDTPADGAERILTGSEIFRYGIRPQGNYLRYTPEKFQQTAPTALYRAKEKLLYRFVCDTPVFTYDDRQTLTLNSGNILIPHLEGLHIKYILAVLNSSASAFYLEKTYHSVKLLRAHLEALPIPPATATQQEEAVQLVDALLRGDGDRAALYAMLDKKITALYRLTDKQQQTLDTALCGKRRYLC